MLLVIVGVTLTNAGFEGTNRVIKTTARDAHGFRNPRKPASAHPLRHHPTRTRTPQPRLNSKSPHVQTVI